MFTLKTQHSFYLVGNAKNPAAEFQRAIVDGVKQVIRLRYVPSSFLFPFLTLAPFENDHILPHLYCISRSHTLPLMTPWKGYLRMKWEVQNLYVCVRVCVCACILCVCAYILCVCVCVWEGGGERV